MCDFVVRMPSNADFLKVRINDSRSRGYNTIVMLNSAEHEIVGFLTLITRINNWLHDLSMRIYLVPKMLIFMCTCTLKKFYEEDEDFPKNSETEWSNFKTCITKFIKFFISMTGNI